MAKSEVLNGDQIAEQIKGRTENSNMADIAREVHDMMDHTKDSSADLAKVNQALHDAGILPGVTITGVQGADFVGRNDVGAVVKVDSTDLGHSKVDTTSSTTPINGRDATINSDGSGEITVKPGDSGYRISRDMLKSQGVEHPTDREVAMYNEKLNQLNGDAMKHLHPGDVLKLPPALKDGIDSTFFGARALDTETASKAATMADYNNMTAAMVKGNHWHWGAPNSMSKEQIDEDMKQTGLTDEQIKGYQFMKDHFDTLKSSDGQIWQTQVDEYRDHGVRDAELLFFKNTNGGMM